MTGVPGARCIKTAAVIREPTRNPDTLVTPGPAATALNPSHDQHPAIHQGLAWNRIMKEETS